MQPPPIQHFKTVESVPTHGFPLLPFVQRQGFTESPMNNPLIGSLNFSEIIQRKLTFHLDNDILPKEGNENSDRGKQEALEKMLADSGQLTEAQFESKYLAELADLKARAEAKQFSIDDGDDYYESYNNAVVGVLKLINPLHLYDLSD